jgi:hypothetical protein
MNFLY